MNNTYTYKRYMRDGTVEERTGHADPLGKRVRKGKTTRKRSR